MDMMTLVRAVRAAGFTTAGSSLQRGEAGGRRMRSLLGWRTAPCRPPGRATHIFCWALGLCAAHSTTRRAAGREAVKAAVGRAWARACILLIP